MGNNRTTKYNWPEIQTFLDAVKGIEAIEKLTGESPHILLNKPAQNKWEAVGKMTDEFYKLDIQERLYESGMATRPTEATQERKDILND